MATSKSAQMRSSCVSSVLAIAFTRPGPSEYVLQLPHVGGATLIGASITCSQGVYPAELQAIARTLAMLPLSFNIHIHSDSEASIAAINSFRRELNERARMRMAARPILQLIDELFSRPRSVGGDLTISHVRAHTDDDDIHSIGNRIADFQANRARNNPMLTTPIGLQQLPLAECEHHLHVKQLSDSRVVIDDVRRSSRNRTRAQDLAYWSGFRNHQGTFACDGAIELGRVVLKEGSTAQQKTLVHVATNSIHFHWYPPDDPDATLEQVQCDGCKVALTLDHLATCFAPSCVDYRLELQNAILAEIDSYPDTRNWHRSNREGDLFTLYLLDCFHSQSLLQLKRSHFSSLAVSHRRFHSMTSRGSVQ
jgi:ribonuclease HI